MHPRETRVYPSGAPYSALCVGLLQILDKAEKIVCMAMTKKFLILKLGGQNYNLYCIKNYILHFAPEY